MSPRILEQSPGHYRLQWPQTLAAEAQATEIAEFLASQGRSCWAEPEFTYPGTGQTEALLRVLPQVQLPPSLVLDMDLPPVQEVNAELLQSHLVELQQRLAQAEAVSRGVQAGDRVRFSAYAEQTGIPLPGSLQSSHQGLVRSDLIAPGFDKQLLGLKAGQQTQFRLQLKTPLAGQPQPEAPVRYHVWLEQVEALSLPAMESLPSLTGHESLKALWQALQTELQAHYTHQWRQFVRQALVLRWVEQAQVEMPGDLFLAQQRLNWQAQQGQHLQALGLSAEDCEGAWRLWSQDPEQQAQVYRELKTSLVLKEWAQAQGESVSDRELLVSLRPMAEAFDLPLESLYQQMAETGQLDALSSQILAERLSDTLWKEARLSFAGQPLPGKA